MFHLSAILSGFSIVSCMILLFAYLFFLPSMQKTVSAKVASAVVLVGLSLLQMAHYLFFSEGAEPLSTRSYCSLLMLLPIAFFFFGREVLFLGANRSWLDVLHLIPFLVCLFMPLEFVPSIAFLIGTAYTFWFVKLIYKLRNQHARFKFEIFFFGMFALMAFAALLLGLSLSFIDHAVFYLAYANFISIAILLIVTALLIFPELLNDILLIAELAYAKSKLTGIDSDQKVVDLEKLMTYEKYYENEDLNLSSLAAALELSSHQLSELINTEYGYGFPRFVREHRVRAAKSLLISEPSSSVLSISMMTGFKSQSNFYTAFKEITGESPGNYRSKRAK